MRAAPTDMSPCEPAARAAGGGPRHAGPGPSRCRRVLAREPAAAVADVVLARDEREVSRSGAVGRRTIGPMTALETRARSEPGRRRRPGPLAAITAVSLLALVVGYRRDLAAAATAIVHGRPGWLALLTLLAACGLLFVGMMFRGGQRTAGVELGVRTGLRLGTAAYALNLVVKSSGLAGLAVFLRWARAHRRPEGSVLGGYLLSTLLNHLAFGVVLVAALAAVTAGGRLTTIDAIAAALFAAYVVAHVAAAWAALRHPTLLARGYALPGRLLARLRRATRRPPRPVADTSSASAELTTALALARARPGAVARTAGWALAVDVVHVAWLWAALHAVGVPAGIDVALVAYGIATLFGIIGFLPAGLGFVEVGMAATLASYSVPVSQATAAVVLFRLAELWLPLAAGALASRRLRAAEPAS